MESTMDRRVRRTCPICGKENFLKLHNHLAQVHGLNAQERQQYLGHVQVGRGIEALPKSMDAGRSDMYYNNNDEQYTYDNEHMYDNNEDGRELH